MTASNLQQIAPLTARENVFNAIKQALPDHAFTKPDNQRLHALSQAIAIQIREKQSSNESDDLPQDIKEALNKLNATSSDEDLRTGARMVLIHRIKTDSIKGADLGKFVELLDLGKDDDKVSFLSVEFSELVGLAHPLPGLDDVGRESLRDLIIEQMRASDWSETIQSLSAEGNPEGAGGSAGGTVGSEKGIGRGV